MKRTCLSLAVLSAYSAFAVFEHAVFESVPLDGEWEMSYSPYEHRSVAYPDFRGVRIPQAVPGYWEDMRGAFRAAGMTDEFRINPWYERQTFPIGGSASDTTLPDAVLDISMRLSRHLICWDCKNPAGRH